jgi:two-component system sensor histidine kinase CpxA
MRIRLPLYAKILLWFFLNLAAMAAVVVVLFNVQFNFNLDWLLVTGARERIEAARDLITGELDTTSPDEWPQVLQRYSQAHHVDFAIFSDDDAQPVVGNFTELPDEVRARILAPPTFPGAPLPSPPATAPPSVGLTAPNAERSTPPSFNPNRRRWPRTLRAIMRTTQPTQYWLLATGWLDNPMAGERMRIVLVARSSSISGGGLVFDPTPWLWLAFGVIVFTLFFWLPLIRGITRSVARMVHATRQIADGRLDVRVPVNRGDELGALGESINEMAARLDGLVVGQKRFLADIAHELCAPVARLQMALGILEQRAPAGEEAAVRAAAERAEQIAALVGELLSFSKAAFGAAAVPLQPVELADVVTEAVRREKTDSAEIRVDLLLDVRVSGNPDLLVRALANLLRNAIQHTTVGPITIHAARDGEAIVVTVADSGPGVPEAELPKIFDAFYRVDASRSRDTGGAGLGLAIVKTCVESCGGTVSARNREPQGLEVQIRLHASP